MGIAFEPDYDGPLPEECHLLIDGEEIVGRITSIAHRSTVGHALALAFIRPNMTEPGTQVKIRLDDGRLVPAKVIKLPFYDPENKRQD